MHQSMRTATLVQTSLKNFITVEFDFIIEINDLKYGELEEFKLRENT